MLKTKDGKKVHVLKEFKNDGVDLVAYKFYDKSKKQWVMELKPKHVLV
ncbi:TPA: hypothetical protein PXM28_001481 [Yersinia enterocolitica]|nr:hypothetical protein [Yersinia enterocolitica]